MHCLAPCLVLGEVLGEGGARAYLSPEEMREAVEAASPR